MLAVEEAMTSDLDNFKAWYKDTLEKLYLDKNSGFPILMIAFPLLERYLRHKNGLGYKDKLNNGYMDELRSLFPVLPTNKIAQTFWHVFRNGLLHQVTFSHEHSGNTMPAGWLSYDIDTAVKIESDGSFIINPKRFAEDIVETIENNFGIYKKVSEDSTQLPNVKPHPTAKRIEQGVPSIVLGTSTEN